MGGTVEPNTVAGCEIQNKFTSFKNRPNNHFTTTFLLFLSMPDFGEWWHKHFAISPYESLFVTSPNIRILICKQLIWSLAVVKTCVTV